MVSWVCCGLTALFWCLLVSSCCGHSRLVVVVLLVAVILVVGVMVVVVRIAVEHLRSRNLPCEVHKSAFNREADCQKAIGAAMAHKFNELEAVGC